MRSYSLPQIMQQQKQVSKEQRSELLIHGQVEVPTFFAKSTHFFAKLTSLAISMRLRTESSSLTLASRQPAGPVC
jgi:hypothetical protein